MTESLLLKIKQRLEPNQAFLIHSSDEFLSEYTPQKYKRLELVTGFSGSNGFAVISDSKNYLFTDGRYTNIARSSMPDFEVIEDLGLALNSCLQQFKKLLIDGRTISLSFHKRLKSVKDLEVVFLEENLVDQLSEEVVEEDFALPLLHDDAIAGATTEEKLQMVLPKITADYLLLMNPDSICWLLNIRGTDVPYCGVYNAYLLLSRHGNTTLIRDPRAVDKHLDLIVSNYQKINVDPNKCLAHIYNKYKDHIIDLEDPCELLKATKNKQELIGFHKAHFIDGLSLLKLNKWVWDNIGNKITELDVSAKLLEIKQEFEDFIIPSFETIAAYADNGAVIHYKPSLKTNKTIKSDNLFLLDSGSHFSYGTTDVTRTFHYGNASVEQKAAYTMVLKGLINLSSQKFPKGTKERELDCLARRYLWNSGMQYNHSTGHGVGQYLSVHERPNRMNKASDVELMPNMLITIEPGYYIDDQWGIRLENMVVVKESEFLGFLEFETLTKFPFELTLIEQSLLSDDELMWLILYHKDIFETYKELLSEEEIEFYIKKYLPQDIF